MKAFPTGSRVYGTPRPDSDYDLVVRVSEDDLEFLFEASGNAYPDDYGPHSVSIKFGNLNVVACLTDEAYAVWCAATAEAKKLGTISRPAAVDLFRAQIKRSLS